MKNLIAVLFIALTVFASLPVFAAAYTISTTKNEQLFELAAYMESEDYHIHGNRYQTFTRYVNRGHVDVLVVGDGSTDLDLFVKIGDTIYKSDGSSDDEKVCLGNITRSGYIEIVVYNRGNVANNYELIIK